MNGIKWKRNVAILFVVVIKLSDIYMYIYLFSTFLITLVVLNAFYSTENLLMACLWVLVLEVLLVMALLLPSILIDFLLRSTTICLRHLDKKSE